MIISGAKVRLVFGKLAVKSGTDTMATSVGKQPTAREESWLNVAH